MLFKDCSKYSHSHHLIFFPPLLPLNALLPFLLVNSQALNFHLKLVHRHRPGFIQLFTHLLYQALI